MRLFVDRPMRADKLVAARFPGVGRRAIARLFHDGAVRVNGKRAQKGKLLAAGDVVDVLAAPPDAEALRPVPEPDRELEVLFADELLVAVAKPPGIPTQPLRAKETGTLAGALIARFPECAGVGDDPREAGLAHRLDTGTSGVIVAARDQATWRALRAAFHEGRVEKHYLALVAAPVDRPGELDEPIAHDHGRGGVKVGDHEGALPARTRWEPTEALGGHTLLHATVDTGRMHQVRAHLAHAGMPIVGDVRYGGPPAPPPLVGHFLHAERLVLEHPARHARLEIVAPLPADRAETLRRLRLPG